MKNKSGPTVPPGQPDAPSARPRPEINSPESALLVGNMVGDLWQKYQDLKVATSKLIEEAKADAVVAAERERGHLARLGELERQNDDLRGREHRLQEELILAREDASALRNDILHLESTIGGSAERVRAQRDDNFIERGRRPARDLQSEEFTRELESQLTQVANIENAKATEPQPQRLDARPVTKIPEDL